MLIATALVFAIKYLKTDALPISTETCTQWERSGIQFRWCKDPGMSNATTYQFYNGYKFKVRYFFKIDFTNGETYEGNNTLNAETQDEQGSMNKRIPVRWGVTKKMREDSDGKWVEFN